MSFYLVLTSCILCAVFHRKLILEEAEVWAGLSAQFCVWDPLAGLLKEGKYVASVTPFECLTEHMFQSQHTGLGL